MEKLRFSCLSDAEKSLRALQHQYRNNAYDITGDIQTIEQLKRKPGRPKVGDTPTVLQEYKIELNIGAIQTEWEENNGSNKKRRLYSSPMMPNKTPYVKLKPFLENTNNKPESRHAFVT